MNIDRAQDIEKSFDVCSSNDGDHYFTVECACAAEFVRGNAHCKRVTRFFVYCARCGQGRWEEDLEAPVIE